MHQGWLKLVQNLWHATPDGGLAALVYAPSEVSATVRGGVAVRVTEETTYPFEESVRFRIQPSMDALFPMCFRVPGWSKSLELVPGVTERVTVPSRPGERFIPLTITSADGFVPAEIEQSRDRRLLGAWIAFIPDDIARTSATP